MLVSPIHRVTTGHQVRAPAAFGTTAPNVNLSVVVDAPERHAGTAANVWKQQVSSPFAEQ